MDLKDKVIVVTGATGGIGRELVKRLNESGAILTLVSRTESELKSLIKELGGAKNSYFVCDLANQEETQKVAAEISAKIPKIDILIGAAGVGIYKPIEESSLDEWNKSMNVIAASNFIFIKKLQKNLEESEEPLVFVIGSGAGVIPMAGRSLYCTAKFALRGLILSLNEEFARTKLRFCLITLGSTLTSFGPMSLEEKQREALSGKAYFTIEWVGKKLVQIIMDDVRDLEYKLYPGDYGFGSWTPPSSN